MLRALVSFLAFQIAPSFAQPNFVYNANQIPSWPIATFQVTKYNATTTPTNNRLHIELFYDDPNNPSIALTRTQNGNFNTQQSNTTPDPLGILTNLYSQSMSLSGRFVLPYIKMTIPIKSWPTNAKLFTQGFKPEGIAHGIPITYVTSPKGLDNSLSFTMPLNPFDVTWCDPFDPSRTTTYKCPPGSPWNAGIPYFYPKAANLDVNDAVLAVLEAVASYGALYNVTFTTLGKSFTIPYIPFVVKNMQNAIIPMFQNDGILINHDIVYPPLTNGL